MRADQLTPALRAAALTLRVDAVTVEVVSRLREEGVRSILLKGPSIAAWLYADGTPRPYTDTDLLVGPEALRQASRALRAAGFREQPGVSSYTWLRGSDGSIVDLHDRLFGTQAPREHTWAALCEGTEKMEVGTLEVEVLSRPARLLYIVLHAAQHESNDFGRPLRDLDRALALADEALWIQAARLAGRLKAMPTFAAGLRLHPDGAQRAHRMGLPLERPFQMSLRRVESTRPHVVTLERLATTRGLLARLRFLGRRLAPPPDYMRWRHPTLACRGRLGLILAYVWRPVSIIPKLPTALVARKRARRDHED
jgi:hypothetical protein